MTEYKKVDINDTVGKLFVGGLDWSSTIESLTAYFEKFGTVNSVELKRNPTDPSKHRGFAFVKFATASAASDVIKQKEAHVIDGRKVDAKAACPPGVKPDERTKKIFVGGLQAETTEEAMLEYFGAFGAIKDNKITFTVDRATGKKRGFCFIEFEDEAFVDRIVAQKFHEVAGRRLETKRAEDKRQGPPRSAGGASQSMSQSQSLAGLYPAAGISAGYQQPIIYVSPESLQGVYSALGMCGMSGMSGAVGNPSAIMDAALYGAPQYASQYAPQGSAGRTERRTTYGSRRAAPY